MLLNGIKFFSTNYSTNFITSATFNPSLAEVVPIMRKIMQGRATLSEAQELMSKLRTIRKEYPHNPGDIAFDPQITATTNSPASQGIAYSYTGYLTTQKPTLGTFSESTPSGADVALRFFISNIDYYFDGEGIQTNDVSKSLYTLRLSGPHSGSAASYSCNGQVAFNHPIFSSAAQILRTYLENSSDDTSRALMHIEYQVQADSGMSAFAERHQIPCEIELIITDVVKYISNTSDLIKEQVVQLVNNQFPQR